jgi:hypothetical protein
MGLQVVHAAQEELIEYPVHKQSTEVAAVAQTGLDPLTQVMEVQAAVDQELVQHS